MKVHVYISQMTWSSAFKVNVGSWIQLQGTVWLIGHGIVRVHKQMDIQDIDAMTYIWSGYFLLAIQISDSWTLSSFTAVPGICSCICLFIDPPPTRYQLAVVKVGYITGQTHQAQENYTGISLRKRANHPSLNSRRLVRCHRGRLTGFPTCRNSLTRRYECISFYYLSNNNFLLLLSQVVLSQIVQYFPKEYLGIPQSSLVLVFLIPSVPHGVSGFFHDFANVHRHASCVSQTTQYRKLPEKRPIYVAS